MRKYLWLLSAFFFLSEPVRADHCGTQVCGRCPAPCAAGSLCGPIAPCFPQVACSPVANCQPQFRDLETVVYEPQLVNERRTICTVECRAEERVRQVTVYNTIVERRQVPCNVTVMVPEVRRRTENWVDYRSVWEDKVENYTVMVPSVERRQGTRTVCRPVQARATRMVCEDQGHWEERPLPVSRCLMPVCVPCGSVAIMNYCSAPRVCRVWVPKLVQRPVEYTYCRLEFVQEPCEYSVAVCRQEQRQRNVRTCRLVVETKSRDVEYTVCVPRVEQRLREVVEHRCVPSQREDRYTVMVPHEVEREINVQVCRMVPRRVVQRIPMCEPCRFPACDSCCY